MNGKKIVEYFKYESLKEEKDVFEFYIENISRMLRALREANADPLSLSISTEDSIAPLEKRLSIVCTRSKDDK